MPSKISKIKTTIKFETTALLKATSSAKMQMVNIQSLNEVQIYLWLQI